MAAGECDVALVNSYYYARMALGTDDDVSNVAVYWPEAEPGRGSCIFIHQWRRPGYPTAGCVAFRRDHLRQIARRITPDTRLIVRG